MECPCGKKVNYSEEYKMFIERVYYKEHYGVSLYNERYFCDECGIKLLKEAGIKNNIYFYVDRSRRRVIFYFKHFSIRVYFYGKKGRPIINIIRTAFKKIKKEFY